MIKGAIALTRMKKTFEKQIGGVSLRRSNLKGSQIGMEKQKTIYRTKLISNIWKPIGFG
jgi:hypothetical protein